jgi:hypothetical protein
MERFLAFVGLSLPMIVEVSGFWDSIF